MPLNKFWEFIETIKIKHFLFMTVTSLSLLVIGIVGRFVIVDQFLFMDPAIQRAVITFHWCFIGVGIVFALLSIGTLFAILDIV